MKYKALLTWLQSLMPECWDPELRSELPELQCYILDEGGFIVANNQFVNDDDELVDQLIMASRMQVIF